MRNARRWSNAIHAHSRHLHKPALCPLRPRNEPREAVAVQPSFPGLQPRRPLPVLIERPQFVILEWRNSRKTIQGILRSKRWARMAGTCVWKNRASSLVRPRPLRRGHRGSQCRGAGAFVAALRDTPESEDRRAIFTSRGSALLRRNRHGDLRWQSATVSPVTAILKNPAYAGTYVYRGTWQKPSRTLGAPPQKSRRTGMGWRIAVRDNTPPISIGRHSRRSRPCCETIAQNTNTLGTAGSPAMVQHCSTAFPIAVSADTR